MPRTEEYLSPVELASAFSKIIEGAKSQDDKKREPFLRLNRMAQLICQRYNLKHMNNEDLIQETITQALSHRRNCPRTMKVFDFLRRNMKWIAQDELSKQKRQDKMKLQQNQKLEELSESRDYRNLPSQELNCHSLSRQPERDLEARETIMNLLSLFNNDPVAKSLVIGIASGCEGKDLQHFVGINDEILLATKRRLIRRRLQRHFPQGWGDEHK